MQEADLLALHPEHKIVALHVIIGAVARRRRGKTLNEFLDMLRWMLDRGADPLQEAPPDCPYVLSLVKHVNLPDDDDTTYYDDSEPPAMVEVAVELPFKNRSPIAATAALMTKMREAPRQGVGTSDWEAELSELQKLMIC